VNAVRGSNRQGAAHFFELNPKEEDMDFDLIELETVPVGEPFSLVVKIIVIIILLTSQTISLLTLILKYSTMRYASFINGFRINLIKIGLFKQTYLRRVCITLEFEERWSRSLLGSSLFAQIRVSESRYIRKLIMQ